MKISILWLRNARLIAVVQIYFLVLQVCAAPTTPATPTRGEIAIRGVGDIAARSPSNCLGSDLIGKASDRAVLDRKVKSASMELGERLGFGAFGSVYRVLRYDPAPQLPVNKIALKVFPPEIGRTVAQAKQDIANEIAALRKKEEFKHGGTIEETGYFFIVMTLLSGKALPQTPQYENKRNLGAQAQKKFMKQMQNDYCDEVAEVASTKKIFQWDPSPKNGLFRFVGDTDKVEKIRIVDWGLAKNVRSLASRKDLKARCLQESEATFVYR